MKWLIWSIRTWFCKHDWEREDHTVLYHDGDPDVIIGRETFVSATCNQCGWHRKYSKFQ